MKQRKRNNLGFTMAELLIVVAIIIVLSGVAFLAVQRYHRGMAQLERDSIAKEIFVAAQNHLTQANSQGYPGVTDFGKVEDEANNIYYYVVNDGFTWESTSAIDQMLPFGAIEEHTRARGSYIIRYQSNPAVVLDVFYCPPEGQYAHQLAEGDYVKAMGLKDEIDDETGKVTTNNREKRRDVSDWGGAVLGWYGGAESLQTGAEINAPDIRVENGDRLIVKVYDTNIDKRGVLEGGTEDVSLKLIVTGVTSKAQWAIALHVTPDYTRYTINETLNEYTVVLDDITKEGMHFADLNTDLVPGDRKGKFIPGEDIVISAVAFSNKALTNVAYSREYTTNSLFADMEPDDETEDATDNKVYVDSIRHLENLDKAVSSLVNQSSEEVEDSENPYDIKKAVQTRDLDWGAFKTSIDATSPDNVQVFYDSELTVAGCYKPVDLNYSLTYDGRVEAADETLEEDPALTPEPSGEEESKPDETLPERHSITGIKVNEYSDNAGVFGSVSAGCKINNLEIVNCDINATGSTGALAGALAGKLTGVDVKNVVAFEAPIVKEDGTEETVSSGITATGSAGGLIGSMNGGSVEQCAAALFVTGDADAGGLIGAISGTGARVEKSYAGGHTENGAYDPDKINVTGGANAGGLIGSAGGATVEKCYSTCSVKGATAGGLAGTASGEIRNSYCTGLVVGKDEDAVVGAFAGVLTSGIDKVAGCKYFEIINGDLSALGTGSTEGLVVDALDADTKSYNDFVGGPGTWNAAQPYDEKLETYYKVAGEDSTSRFNLRTVDQIDQETKKKSEKVHYGDWPAPEIFVTNEAE